MDPDQIQAEPEQRPEAPELPETPSTLANLERIREEMANVRARLQTLVRDQAVAPTVDAAHMASAVDTDPHVDAAPPVNTAPPVDTAPSADGYTETVADRLRRHGTIGSSGPETAVEAPPAPRPDTASLAPQLEAWAEVWRGGPPPPRGNRQRIDTDTRIAELEGQVRDLEAARRAEVGELQRSAESLANTQLELVQATKKLRAAQDRVRDLERRLTETGIALEAGTSERLGDARPVRTDLAARVSRPAPKTEPKAPESVLTDRAPAPAPMPERRESAEADGVPAVPVAVPAATPDRKPAGAAAPAARKSLAERFAERGRRDPATPEDGGDPGSDDGRPDDAALALRDRLTRAAAARHRQPGS